MTVWTSRLLSAASLYPTSAIVTEKEGKDVRGGYDFP